MMKQQTGSSFWRTPSGWIALAFIAFGLYFLLVEHREHVFAFLPYAILLLCPLMHIFMHGGHGHDRQGKTKSNDDQRKGTPHGH